MRRRLCALLLVLAMAGAAIPGLARAANAPEIAVRSFYATLLDTMKHAAQLGQKGRYDALAPAIRGSFDLAAMTQMAVGPPWTGFSPAQRQSVTDAFARYTIATYANRFDGYSGETFEVTGDRSTPYGTIVRSRMIRPHADPVVLDYLMRQNGGRWQVADVYLTGTVSQVASLRSQFSAVLSRGGVASLVATLNRKADTLVASSTGS